MVRTTPVLYVVERKEGMLRNAFGVRLETNAKTTCLSPCDYKTDIGFYKSLEANCSRNSNAILEADGAIGVPVSFFSWGTSRRVLPVTKFPAGVDGSRATSESEGAYR